MKKELQSIIFRYALIILAGLGNLYIFYKILTPLTIKAVSSILATQGQVFVKGTSIITEQITILLVPACIAGAAFYLLFILIFSTPNIKPIKRIQILVFSFVALFILNLARIILLFSIFDQTYFAVVHWIFWHLISTVFVVGIWLFIVKINKIKSVPIYSDLKYLLKIIGNKNQKHYQTSS